jgi:phosphatidylserine decarboxylase
MSVFNCHVNRSPASGRVSAYTYTPGRKMAAFDVKSSLENEQNRITIDAARGPITFKQIAGALARRIIFRLRPGDPIARGERIGMIRFGSRVDLFAPDGTEILVERGNKVKAGKTAVAQWK